MRTETIFQNHNKSLLDNLIPKGDEEITARSWVDCAWEDFNEPLNKQA